MSAVRMKGPDRVLRLGEWPPESEYRTESVWWAWKPGEERRYASPTPFARWFLQVLGREGYFVTRIDFPVHDPVDSVVKTSMVRGITPAKPEVRTIGKSKSRSSRRGRERGRPHQAGKAGRGRAR